jgi:hypothetical protein
MIFVKKGDDNVKNNFGSAYTLEHHVNTTKEITVLELNDEVKYIFVAITARIRYKSCQASYANS